MEEGEQIKEWGEDHRPRLFGAATKWILLKTDKLGNVCCTGNHVTRPSHGMGGGVGAVQVRKRTNESTSYTTVVLEKLLARPLDSHSPSSMEHECSSPRSQVYHSTLEPTESQEVKPRPNNLFKESIFILHFLLRTVLRSGPAPLGLQTKILHAFLTSPMCATSLTPTFSSSLTSSPE
jgi:hypothetical protein